MKLASLLLITLFSFQSFAQLDSLQAVFAARDDSPEKVDWMCGIAFDYYTIDPAITEQIGLQAIELGKKFPDSPVELAKAYHITGISYWTRDLHQQALSNYHLALPLYEQGRDARRANSIRLDIANIYGNIRQFQNAIDQLRRVYETAKASDDTLVMAWAINNMGSNFNDLKQYDSSTIYYKRAIPFVTYLGDTVGLALVHSNIASNLILEEKHREAYDQLLIARKQLALKYDAKRLAEVYYNMASCQLAFGFPQLAKQYLDSSAVEAKAIDSKRIESNIMQGYADVYQELGRYEDAIQLIRDSHAIQDSISGLEVQKQVEVLELQYQNEKKEKELAVLSEEEAREESIRNIILILLISVALVAALLIIIIQTRNKKRRLENELSLKKLREELTIKNKEISSYTLNFIQRNEIMESLKEQINELKKQSTSDTNKQLTRMNRLVDDTFRADEEWETFMLTFEQMHDGFFASLKEHYPDLGNAELKLCALLRLNMNLKESARILGISPDSVKTARYRLRKKFKLKTEENLVDFLISFEQDQLSLSDSPS